VLNALRYTSKMLLAAIDETHKGTYDFLYLPIDFKVTTDTVAFNNFVYYHFCAQYLILVILVVQNKCNVGYAFINMVSSSHIVSFYQVFLPFLSCACLDPGRIHSDVA